MLNTIWSWALAFLASKSWMPVAIWAVITATNLVKKGTWPPFLQAKPKLQPLFVLVLTQVGAIFFAVQSGAAWSSSAVHAFEVAVWSMGLYAAVTNAFPWLSVKLPWLGFLVGFIPKPTPDDAKADAKDEQAAGA